MGTGFGGTYVLSSEQTKLDGRPVATGKTPQLGQVWSWQGEAVRVDGPQSTLLLGTSLGHDAMRARVARTVRRRFDLAQTEGAPADPAPIPDDLPEGFIISDGASRFTLIPVETGNAGELLLWCANGLPLAGRDYKVVRIPEGASVTRRSHDYGGDVICFTAGTRIRTKNGDKRVETLQVGDHVQTKDNGSQEILWIGTRHVTGARLHAMPELRPIRIRGHALQDGVPDEDLLVSPHHRLLYAGPNAQTLFNGPEVLIAARDMVNDYSVFVDHAVREVTYIHLLFAEHQILWANGVQTESFHPANTTLETVAPEQRQSLLGLFPDVTNDLHSYGPFARRNLTKSETAILLHERV